MMFFVVEGHDFLADVGFESIVGVGKIGECVL
jgi:hypothetical protein